MDEERESQPRKNLSHSIEEILRRPACVRKEKTVQRNWSVIKETTRLFNQPSCVGKFFSLHLSQKLLCCLNNIRKKFIPVNSVIVSI